ncbi:ATP-binding cassette sub-family C member 4-like [Oculina patagonica]
MTKKGYRKVPVEDTVNQHKLHHPLTTANFLSIFAFWWMNNVFRKGTKEPLDQSDFLPLHQEERTRDLTERLQKQWNSDLQKCNEEGTEPKLWKSVIKIISFKEFCLCLSLLLLESVGRIMQPLLIGILVYLLRVRNADPVYLYLCAGLMTFNGLTYILSNYSGFILELLGMKLRSALQGLIFQKITLMGQQTLQEVTTGHVIDLISNDLKRIEQAPIDLLYCMTSLAEIPIAASLMVYLIGWQSILGVLLILATMPYILTISSLCAKIRGQVAEVSDQRISLMDELVSGIRVLKTHAWEENYREKVKELRRNEIVKILKKSTLLAAIEPLCFIIGLVATFISAITIILTDHTLTPENAFMLLTFMNQVLRRDVSFRLTFKAPSVFESFVSFARTQKFLLLQNLPIRHRERDDGCTQISQYSVKGNGLHPLLWSPETFPSVTRPGKNAEDNEYTINPILSAAERHSKKQQAGLTVSRATCSITGSREKSILCDVSFDAPAESLTVITGQVGSGKSTLLSSIAGEVALSSGTIVYSGNIAFVSQKAWVFSGTIRDNILFGKMYNESRFSKVIKVCALQEDMSRFPRGDQTFVGERGVVLSGGQRARVSLARVVYADADVYLLDDPLSAVDVKVGEHIFNQCICQHLGGKIRILVTHSKRHMEVADQVVVLDRGSVMQKGPFSELTHESAVNYLLGTDLDINNERVTRKNDDRDLNTIDTIVPPGDSSSPEHLEISEEDRVIGAISFKLYWKYFKAGMHPIGAFALFVLFIAMQVVMTSPSVWLSYLTRMPLSHQRDSTTLSIYAGLVCGSLVLGFVCAFVFFHVCLRSSERLHDNMVTSILHAPVLFFDINPAGRILNRFSQDVGSMDEDLPMKFVFLIQIFLLLFFSVLVPAVANFWILLIVVPFAVLFVYLASFYLRTSRELKRLESICRSPVFSHFSETMTGLDTIRTQKMESEFIDQFYRRQDLHNQVFSMVLASGRWFGLRVDFLCSVFVGVAAAVCIFVSQDAAVAGLILVFVSETVMVSQYTTRQFAEVENLMTSVERVITYTELDPEPGYSIKTTPRDDWPRDGSISFKNVTLRYYDGGPQILKNLSFKIQGKRKVGIVGRTGDGKSSIIAALLRMPEAEGDISVDGVEVKSVNLQESRGCLSVLSQTPVLFSGSIRKNLDPLATHDDEGLWSALETVQLKPLIEKLNGKLDYVLLERGGNLSVGERQLLCLARTLLQQNKIVILDEPTAQVDPNTEQTIWNIVREKLKNCTVITIAHRLNTIRDCEVIIVMRDGEVAELGSVDALLGREGGVFYSMAASQHSF